MIPPRVLPAVEGEAPPAGYRAEKRMRKGLVIAGATTFGALYLLSIAVAAAYQDQIEAEGVSPLFAPIVGPFLAVGTADATAFPTFLLVFDGLGQALGFGLLLGGVLYPESVWLRTDSVSVTLAPVIVAGAPAGAGLQGRW